MSNDYEKLIDDVARDLNERDAATASLIYEFRGEVLKILALHQQETRDQISKMLECQVLMMGIFLAGFALVWHGEALSAWVGGLLR